MRFNSRAAGLGGGYSGSGAYSGRGNYQKSGGRQNRRQNRNPTIPRTEAEVVAEIDIVLKRWGVGHYDDDAHADFAKTVKAITSDSFSDNVLDNWEPFDVTQALPEDKEEALRVLLRRMIVQVTNDGAKVSTRVTHDLIKDKYDAFLSFPPYNIVRGDPRLSWAYKELNLDARDLHPLTRFSYLDQDIKEFMLGQFEQATDEEYPSNFIRALVLHEAANGAQHCLGCNQKDSLQWNAAVRPSFCNLVCSNCNSVYTVCCVADIGRVQKLFDKGVHFRGSYTHFCRLKNKLQQDGGDGKMFLLLATRSLAESNGLPVFAAEIKGALPNLNSDSFCPDHIRIRSSLVFEPVKAGNRWFSVTAPRDIDIVSLSMEVFHEYFSALEGEETAPEEGPVECQSTVSDNGKQRQADNLTKFLAQINDIKEKQDRGTELEKWEIDLLGREQKLLKKLEDLEGGIGNEVCC